MPRAWKVQKMINGKDNKMNEENMSKENITDNKPAAEPRFKVGDVVWTARGGAINGHPIFMECRILALHYIWADGESVFLGYRLLGDDNSHSHKPETVFATKEECEDFVDRVIAPKAKKIMESLKDLGELAGEESNKEEA